MLADRLYAASNLHFNISTSFVSERDNVTKRRRSFKRRSRRQNPREQVTQEQSAPLGHLP